LYAGCSKSSSECASERLDDWGREDEDRKTPQVELERDRRQLLFGLEPVDGNGGGWTDAESLDFLAENDADLLSSITVRVQKRAQA
jgi:hypothetical protein